ncbi:sensor histidine kinase [Pedobacter sp. KACC 23697]|uniref:Histidine kinase n=1 Tax=Pedobacter sp. KACC 23697 TaxID=3149230 RepID=A0AAU7K604_9SPHI
MLGTILHASAQGFMFHVGDGNYYSIPDNEIFKGVELLVQYRNENQAPNLATNFQIGLLSRFSSLTKKPSQFWGAPIQVGTKTYPSYLIDDGSAATLIAVGISKKDIKDYKYHVIKNDSTEIVPWSPLSKLEMKYGAKVPYAALGTFTSPEGTIMVEVINKKKYNVRDGVIYDWRTHYKPFITGISMFKDTVRYELTDPKRNNGYSSHVDPLTGAPKELYFPADSIATLHIKFKAHETIPYRICLETLDKNTIRNKELIYYLLKDYYDVETKLLKNPGKYRISIQPLTPGYGDQSKGARGNIVYIPITVKPRPAQEASMKQMLPYILIILSGAALLFFIYHTRNQRKLKTTIQEKQLAGLKLKSIRSQLNPHFMFNALSSIQALMNKNDLDKASYYLSIFSGLTRQVLDGNNEDMLSISDELKMLEDYLQMEQLRFGFQYEISIEKGLNYDNIEIPAMLLQPLVENAVKHGVSGLRELGKIHINIASVHHNLSISLSDNGKGFNPLEKTSGYGIKLSLERITLLNQIYSDQPTHLDIKSDKGGTIITITLTNWLS